MDAAAGEWIEVQWPCHDPSDEKGPVALVWFTVLVQEVKADAKCKYLLRFSDGEQTWSSLRKVTWRRCQPVESPERLTEADDLSGFVHCFELEEEFLQFCDSLHARREELGDTSRGDCQSGENLCGGLVSVLMRREALPETERDMYNHLHQRCIAEVSKAWPGWVQKAAGRQGKARPSQDLRLLQYMAGANFKAHVDSSWPCQVLIYLNEDFEGGHTEFPNLRARYRPQRGKALMWRSVCVGFKSSQPGSLEEHPARHRACEVFNGVKKVVSLHLVLA